MFALALQVSVAGAFRGSRPHLALALAPADAAARAELAERHLAADNGADTARSLAQEAIARDPLQPGALTVLGELAREQGSEQTAVALVRRAERLSRRDLPTQMWLIERARRSGELEALVHHLDVTLRSSESARPRVFPLLAAAAADPRGQEVVIETLARGPNWTLPFTGYAIGSGRDLDFAVRIARMLLDPSSAADRPRFHALLERLVGNGRHALAWQLYADPQLGLGSGQTATIRNGGFDAAEDGTPFDWSFAQEAELWATREQLSEDGGTVLRVAASNGRSGEAARQVLHLSPGSYRLTSLVGDIPQDRYSRPRLRITCAGSGQERELLTLQPGAAGPQPQRLEGSFAVPAGCAFQQVSILISGDGALEGPGPWLDRIDISAIRSGRPQGG